MKLVKSYAEQVEVKCRLCGILMFPDVQVVVDTSLNPEMDALANSGEMRLLTCPKGHTAGLQLPLIIRRPGREPRLIFYPAYSKSGMQVRQELLHWLNLIELLDLGFADVNEAAANCCVVPGHLMASQLQPYESYLKVVGAPVGFFDQYLLALGARELANADPTKVKLDNAVSAWNQLCRASSQTPIWFQRGVHSELAFALSARFESIGDLADLDQSLAAFVIALDYPVFHAAYGAVLRRNQALVYAMRSDRSGSIRDLEAAIGALQLALPDLQEPFSTDAKRMLASMLGARQLICGKQNPISDNTSLEKLVDLARTDDERLRSEADLAIASATFGDTGYDAMAADRAIKRLRSAIAKVDTASLGRVLALDILGRLLQDRYEASQDEAALNEAIAVREEAIDWLESSNDNVLANLLLNNLAYSLRARYVLSGRLTDLEKAGRVVRRAMALMKKGQTPHPVLLEQWGCIASQLYVRDKNSKWLEEAVRVFRRAIELTAPDDPIHRHILPELGICLSELGSQFEDIAYINEAIELLNASVGQPFTSLLSRADAVLNLSSALLTRFHLTNDIEDVHQAISVLGLALEVVPKGTLDEARIVAALACAHEAVDETQCATQAPNDQVGQCLRDACSLRALSPEIKLGTAKSWLGWALRHQQWEEGNEAGTIALEVIKRLTEQQDDRFGKASWLADAQSVSTDIAYVRARLGDLEGAVLALECGRAQLLLHSLLQDKVSVQRLLDEGFGELADKYLKSRRRVAKRENAARMFEDCDIKGDDTRPSRPSRGFIDPGTDPGGFTGRLLESFESKKEMERAELRAVIAEIRQHRSFEHFPLLNHEDLALVSPVPGFIFAYLVITAEGSMWLIRSCSGIEVIWLDEATTALVKERVFGTGGYHRFQLDHCSSDDLLDYLSWAGSTFARPLSDWIQGDRTADESSLRLVLISTGPIALTPLHTCPIHSASDACLLDQCSVEFAPSLAVWAQCHARLSTNVERDCQMLVVANPRPLPSEWIELAAAELEASAISSLLLENATVLRRRDATVDKVIDSIGNANYLHFACHGVFNVLRPTLSGLVLAQGDHLPLLTFLSDDSRLDHVHLAVLSACQTGLSDAMKLPEESVGLVSTLIEIGIPAVIGSLWTVSDAATAILMTRFYGVLFEDGQPAMHPAEALRQAQLWLRDVTVEALQALANATDEELRIKSPMEQRFAKAFRDACLVECIPSGAGPAFARPKYWAAFRYHGA